MLMKWTWKRPGRITALFWSGKIARSISLLLVAIMLSGCHQKGNLEPGNDKSPADEKLVIRNNAAGFSLYELLGNEKNVSKILIVKNSSDELGQLIKTISAKLGEYRKQLDGLAGNNPNLDLHAIELPQGEKATRAAVAKTAEHELLTSSGKEFEFNLLLMQAEALNYGCHLANTAAENSSLPEEIQTFKEMSQTMKNLYDQVILQMRQNN